MRNVGAGALLLLIAASVAEQHSDHAATATVEAPLKTPTIAAAADGTL